MDFLSGVRSGVLLGFLSGVLSGVLLRLVSGVLSGVFLRFRSCVPFRLLSIRGYRAEVLLGSLAGDCDSFSLVFFCSLFPVYVAFVHFRVGLRLVSLSA